MTKHPDKPAAPDPDAVHVQIYADPNTDPDAARLVHITSLAGAAYAGALAHQFGPRLQGVDFKQSAMTFVADMIERAAPRDPMEEMLVMQAVMTHTRVIHLTALANRQTDLDNLRILNEYTDRASNTYRRQMLALAEYRKPPRGGDSFTAIKQANIAGQQVVMNGENSNEKKATNELGFRHADAEPHTSPQALPAEPRGVGVVEGIGTPHEAVGAVHRPEDA